MAVQGQAPNTDAFDTYFTIADLDRDGRVSGVEAVAFFQRFNLPKETLALVWSYAAGGNSYLGRAEFYNALRLVTVAQSGRQLTTDIVKAALYGPAAAKIPAPKINPASSSSGQINGATSAPQANQIVASFAQTGLKMPPSSQMNSMSNASPQPNNVQPQSAPTSFVRPPTSQMTTASLQQSSQSNSMRPPTPQMKSIATSSLQENYIFQRPSQAGFVGPQINSIVNSAPHNNFIRPQAAQVSGSHPVQEFSQGFHAVQNPGLPNSIQEATSNTQIQHALSSPAPSSLLDQATTSFQTTNSDAKSLIVSGNGFSFDSVFGGDIFSATQSMQHTSVPITSTSNSSTSSKMAPVAPKGSIKPGQPANEHVIAGLPPTANQTQRSQSTQNDVPWPKITQSDIRKYTKVFYEVDKNRDGKITGVEARNLFLSWRLPREVLRQVWDLSDQDNDSMLSIREFCVALYLMERFREGRSLPSILPNSVKFDQTLVLLTGQLSSAYGSSVWQQRPVLSQHPIQESSPVAHPTRLEPSTGIPIPSQPNDVVSPVKQKSGVPVLEQNFVNQLNEEEQKALNLKLQEATDADNKIQELEKKIVDCKQKIENYRKQMQEIVLYKSRCDSRLNETIERTVADKLEVEALARKYEDKYKQLGDVPSKLYADQNTFRDIQEKKMHLHNLIAKMEQREMPDIPDGVHQEHADKILSDLDELVKALNERCKKYGLRAKPTSLVELPFGWQPRIQEGAADWDEMWDKFDNDDGFTIIKELTLEVKNVVPLEKQKVTSINSVEVASSGVRTSKSSDDATEFVEPVSEVEVNTVEPLSTGSLLTVVELSSLHNEEGLASTPPVSPGKSAIESPSKEFHSTFSPDAHANENHSEHDDNESARSGEKFTDDVPWGATFDSYDTDSVWGYNPIKTKDAGRDVKRLDSFASDFGMNSLGTDSPSAASVFGKEKSPFFDSVPSTPLFSSSFSPRFNQGPEDHSFDSYSQFDSFNLHDNIFPSTNTLSRFDSMSSTTEPSHNVFSRFDSFGSSADTQREFTRFDSMRSTAEPHETLSRFDSMRSTAEPRETLSRFDSMKSSSDYNHGFSFDDADPFGSGPFRTSESHTSKKSTDYWSSF